MTGRAPAHREVVSVDGPAGSLEAIVETHASQSPVGLALLCHPHPLHQGTMHNKVVHTLARSFLALDALAVRFNFRSVGASQGSFDSGDGERDDVLAVASWMRERWPGLPLYLGGFSFGAAVSLRAASRTAPAALVTVALPVGSISGYLELPQCPWLIVQGDRDEIVDTEAVIRWVNALHAGPEIMFLAADHFFHGRLVELRDGVIRFLRTIISQQPGEESLTADA